MTRQGKVKEGGEYRRVRRVGGRGGGYGREGGDCKGQVKLTR